MAKQGPCWDGYVMEGMKKSKKSGKMVPNCVRAKKKARSYKKSKKWPIKLLPWLLVTVKRRRKFSILIVHRLKKRLTGRNVVRKNLELLVVWFTTTDRRNFQFYLQIVHRSSPFLLLKVRRDYLWKNKLPENRGKSLLLPEYPSTHVANTEKAKRAGKKARSYKASKNNG